MQSRTVFPRRAALASALACVVAPASVLAAEAAVDLDRLVVTASRIAQARGRALAPVEVIDRAQIERRQVVSLPELLRGEAGVSMVNNGGTGKSSSLFLRGTESDHVVVLVDGLKVGSATNGGAAWQDIPLEQIERIEIVRGPFSSLYGSEAIGGVVQIFTRRPAGRFAPSASAAIGSDATRRYGAGIAGRSQAQGGPGGWYAVNVAHEETAGINAYLNSASRYYDADRDGYANDSLSVQGGYRFNERWDADLRALRARSRNEYDGSANDMAKGVQQVVGGRLRYAASDALDLSASLGETADLSDAYLRGAYSSTFDTHRKLGSLQADLAAGPGTLSLGYDWQRDDVDASDAYDVERRINRGAFAQWQQRVAAHSLQASVRRDDNSQFGGKTTGSVLWGWDLNRHLRLGASFGTAFKAPTFNELYYPDYGNPALRPETSRSVELSLRGDYAWGAWTLNAYQTRVDDLIAYDPALTDAAHPFGQPNNIDRARIRGAEAGYDTALAGWTLRTRLTWLDPRADGAVNHGNWLPRRARHSGRIDADRRFGAFNAGASVFGAGARYDNLGNSARLGGYGLVDLRVGYAFGRDWRVALAASNVFDRRYQTAAYYAQPGRSYLLTLRYRPTADAAAGESG